MSDLIGESLEKLNSIEDKSDFIKNFNELFPDGEIFNPTKPESRIENNEENEKNDIKEFDYINQDKNKNNRCSSKIIAPKGNKKRIHTYNSNNSKYNASKRVIIACMKITHNYILKQIRLFLGNIKLRKITPYKLNMPNLTPVLKGEKKNKPELFKKTLKMFYLEYSKPRNSGINTPKKNRFIIYEFLYLNDDKINALLNTPFNVYLKAFLNDEKAFKIENHELIEDFTTYESCFNDVYSLEKKYELKEYILNWIA